MHAVVCGCGCGGGCRCGCGGGCVCPLVRQAQGLVCKVCVPLVAYHNGHQKEVLGEAGAATKTEKKKKKKKQKQNNATKK